ncbi:MAG: gfo/Idh/MocA family oxidoreductase, partial [Planctomycetes bacterium]|nr:gfo/Idh/MocA family oxidoreductase [Planctomycetota bacterium]
IKSFPGDGGSNHQKNFFEAVRSRKRETLHAEIGTAALSSDLAHYANASVRVGRSVQPEVLAEQIKGNALAREALERFAPQLAAWKIDFKKEPWSLGPYLEIDAEKQRFCGGTEYERANKLLRRAYRKPYVVPEQV